MSNDEAEARASRDRTTGAATNRAGTAATAQPAIATTEAGRAVYRESFDDGPGGWLRFVGNFRGFRRLPIRDGAAVCRSPWWVDYNHAPPHGGGYLHLLMLLPTRGPLGEAVREYGGANRFLAGGFPRDFRGARVMLRLRGELELRGAQLCLLVQSSLDGICSGWVLTGQPFHVTREWSEQTVLAAPRPDQWMPLGTRPERADMYGTHPLERVLADVNTNIYLVLFPLDVAPMGPIEGDAARLRAGRDYPIWRSRLPEGYVLIDTVEIAFAAPRSS